MMRQAGGAVHCEGLRFPIWHPMWLAVHKRRLGNTSTGVPWRNWRKGWVFALPWVHIFICCSHWMVEVDCQWGCWSAIESGRCRSCFRHSILSTLVPDFAKANDHQNVTLFFNGHYHYVPFSWWTGEMVFIKHKWAIVLWCKQALLVCSSWFCTKSKRSQFQLTFVFTINIKIVLLCSCGCIVISNFFFFCLMFDYLMDI